MTNFTDIIKKSVLESGLFTTALSIDVILQAMWNILLALLLGVLLYFIYRKSFQGVVYSQTFALSLIGMTVLTSGIIVTISTNVVLSLGMVGALSIVRYRTAVKDPLDLMFLFWAVAIGIATGAGMFYIGLLISAIMVIMLLMFTHRKGPKDEIYILLVHFEGEDIGEGIRKIMGTQKYQIKSRTARGQQVELAMEVRVHKHNLDFAQSIQALPGVKDVSLVQYNGDYIG
ncbi:MAG: DUF4956 domain-containing protein [Eubacteriales bacterium]|nr:DUF4956 domain-containing protein [Eubacteriales bacterium]MDD3882845.1 DUF4956 domain-containing protein [Eubacteriales bacterium]MDD4512119.1 DUF4956 domain-containing protein [Eubacteriales bacterium]